MDHHFAAPHDLTLSCRAAFLAALLIMPTTSSIRAQASGDPSPQTFGLAHVAALRAVTEVAIAPDGSRLAYLVSVPRDLRREDDGPVWRELHVIERGADRGRPFVHGEVSVSSPQFTADGRHIAFAAKRGKDEKAAVWAIPVDGGEARRVAASETDIGAFRLSPDGTQIAFSAAAKEDEARTKAKKKGFDGEVFEEDYQPVGLFVAPFDVTPRLPLPGKGAAASVPRALPQDGSVHDLAWSGDGRHLLLAIAPRPLVDDSYMAKRLRLVRVEDGATVARFENPGKLGQIAVAADGAHVAMIAGADGNDPKEGRLMVAGIDGDHGLRDLLPGLEGHVSHFAWQSAERLVYVADLGTETELGTVDLGGARQPLLRSGDSGVPVILGLDLARDGQHAALRGERSDHPAELYSLVLGEPPQRRSDSNPWLAELPLAPQRVVTWKARDGLELEGILIEPLRPPRARRGPLPTVMIIHGGPESHVRNGWHTTYSRPGQLLAAQGYAVFQPNYRGSTGRGVAFSKLGQGDAAGPEFDDLIDALDHLIDQGIADRDRIGATGGSYGGYATAWLSTRYSQRIRAGVMFNGISNKHSKALTTDIPEEDRAVHTLYDPWTRADYALGRSPVSYVEGATTPLLIVHGMADTRVHPSQSLQLYRALAMLGKAPVRLVRYPGEPHGNRRQASKEDYTRRLVRWMDHFLLKGSGQLPPWQLDHGLAAGEATDAAEDDMAAEDKVATEDNDRED